MADKQKMSDLKEQQVGSFFSRGDRQTLDRCIPQVIKRQIRIENGTTLLARANVSMGRDYEINIFKHVLT